MDQWLRSIRSVLGGDKMQRRMAEAQGDARRVWSCLLKLLCRAIFVSRATAATTVLMMAFGERKSAFDEMIVYLAYLRWPECPHEPRKNSTSLLTPLLSLDHRKSYRHFAVAHLMII